MTTMLHRVLAFCLFAALEAPAASPPWMAEGVCLTPQLTPCQTIRWEVTGWQNVSWGLHAIRRWNGGTTLSYRKDGSMNDHLD